MEAAFISSCVLLRRVKHTCFIPLAQRREFVPAVVPRGAIKEDSLLFFGRGQDSQSTRKEQVAMGSSRRGRHRRHGRAGRESYVTPQQVSRSLRTWWQDSTPLNRILAAIVIAAGMSTLAGVFNALVHISFFLSFFLVPIFLAPVILTIMAGMTAFAMFAFVTAGVGLAFVGTPMFMLAIVAKMLLPVFAVVGLGAAVMTNVLRAGGRAVGWLQTDDEDEFDEDDGDFDEDELPTMEDELADFDRHLHNRGAFTQNSANIGMWTVSQVVDELDICGLSQYRQLFIEERIDGRTLLSLTDEDIRTEFRNTMPLGDRRRLLRLVTSLQKRGY